MQDLSKKRHGRGAQLLHFLLRAGGVFLLLLIAVLSGRATWDMYQKFTLAAQAHDEAQKGLDALQQKQAHIAAAVDALATERGVEQEIRERFGVAKPGEGEITVVRDPKEASSTAQGQKGLFERIWNALFVW
jgi:cell division protein FtsB